MMIFVYIGFRFLATVISAIRCKPTYACQRCSDTGRRYSFTSITYVFQGSI